MSALQSIQNGTSLKSEIQAMVQQLDVTEIATPQDNILDMISSKIVDLQKTIQLYTAHDIDKAYSKLTQRLIALHYRTKQLDRNDADLTLQCQLKVMVLQWQNSHPLNIRKSLNADDLKKIDEICCYHNFVNLLHKNEKIRDVFFTWVFRNRLDVKHFIEFPALSKKLLNIHLAERIGLMTGKKLQIGRPFHHKFLLRNRVTIPMMTSKGLMDINLLDPTSVVEMKGNWSLKISEICKIFAQKEFETGNLEYFPYTGIENWCAKEFGVWDNHEKRYKQIEFQVENWWENLPVFAKIDEETLKTRYGVSVETSQWIACPKSTREIPGMNIAGTHGYIEVAIPLANGLYGIYPFGKYAAKYPVSLSEKLCFLGNTVEGRIQYPDENVYSSTRQQGSHPIVLTSDQGINLMNLIKRDIVRGLEGNIVFQLGYENCACWVEELLTQAVPQRRQNLYQTEFLVSDTGSSMINALFSFVRTAPQYIRNLFVKFLGLLLGSWRVRKVVEDVRIIHKSIYTNDHHQKGLISHPGNLLQQISNGHLTGAITFGH